MDVYCLCCCCFVFVLRFSLFAYVSQVISNSCFRFWLILKIFLVFWLAFNGSVWFLIVILFLFWFSKVFFQRIVIICLLFLFLFFLWFYGGCNGFYCFCYILSVIYGFYIIFDFVWVWFCFWLCVIVIQWVVKYIIAFKGLLRIVYIR